MRTSWSVWRVILQEFIKEILRKMITCMDKETEEEGQVLTAEIGETMIETEADQETRREEEEVTMEHHGRDQILVLGTVHQIETIDQPQEKDTTEALQEEDTKETLQEEDITETIPQTDTIDLAPKKDTDLNTHPTIKKDLKVGRGVVTMVEMGQERKEMVAREETLIAEKEGATASETTRGEEEEKVKDIKVVAIQRKGKAKTARLDAFGADQRIIWQ